ncbi:hypothetical protein B0H15DRAFT_156529 [Mycena belliarum]|uniref:Uncharacterized protein n=1 Tax=Mycena belliarum TaxID=1033014 RepID=A0AAD6XR53_9AGAR|nr:hypothetical protein B0H15DRAFT_156529 [Mycena belliae]
MLPPATDKARCSSSRTRVQARLWEPGSARTVCPKCLAIGLPRDPPSRRDENLKSRAAHYRLRPQAWLCVLAALIASHLSVYLTNLYGARKYPSLAPEVTAKIPLVINPSVFFALCLSSYPSSHSCRQRVTLINQLLLTSGSRALLWSPSKSETVKCHCDLKFRPYHTH